MSPSLIVEIKTLNKRAWVGKCYADIANKFQSSLLNTITLEGCERLILIYWSDSFGTTTSVQVVNPSMIKVCSYIRYSILLNIKLQSTFLVSMEYMFD